MREKNISTSKEEREGERWQDWALVGSVIGNIFQAIKQASTADNLNAVRQALQRITADRNFLLQRLKEWQNAYFSLKNKVNRLEKEVLNTENELSRHQEELYRLQREQETKDEEIQKLKKVNLQLKKENEELKKEKGGRK